MSPWKSIQRQDRWTIQTTGAALVLRLPSEDQQAWPSFDGEAPTVCVTSLQGVSLDDDRAPVITVSAGEGRIEVRDDDPSVPMTLSPGATPTLCAGGGPFRVTGPGWAGSLTFQPTVDGRGPRLEVLLSGADGTTRRREVIDGEARIRIDGPDGPSLLVVRLVAPGAARAA